MERVERFWVAPSTACARPRDDGAETSLRRNATLTGAATPMTDGAARPVAGSLDDLDEGGLVNACLAGRREAFDVIVERHRRPVYQLCYRFLGNHEDASDLAQEVFLRAYRGLKNFKGDASLATWLYRIGVNACLNRLASRSHATEPLDESEPTVDSAPDQVSRLLERERSRRVRSAIARLPRKQRTTLILRVYHELSHQEIADIVGSSVGAVKANFFHALQNLKRLLGNEPV